MTVSAIDSTRLESSLDTLSAALREKQAETAAIAGQIEAAKQALAQLEQAHTATIRQQGAVSETIAIIEAMIALKKESAQIAVAMVKAGAPMAADASDGEQKLVARIGDQHYRMLHAIRAATSLSLPEVASSSFVLPRRVRVQMNEDIERGVVASVDGRYVMTAKGADYISRFEDFRRLSGLPLPSLQPDRWEQEQEAGMSGRASETESQSAEGVAG